MGFHAAGLGETGSERAGYYSSKMGARWVYKTGLTYPQVLPRGAPLYPDQIGSMEAMVETAMRSLPPSSKCPFQGHQKKLKLIPYLAPLTYRTQAPNIYNSKTRFDNDLQAHGDIPVTIRLNA